METGRLSSDYSFRSQQSKIEKNSFLSCVYGKRAKYKYEKKGEIYWEISKIFFFFNSHVGQIFFLLVADFVVLCPIGKEDNKARMSRSWIGKPDFGLIKA